MGIAFADQIYKQGAWGGENNARISPPPPQYHTRSEPLSVGPPIIMSTPNKTMKYGP